MNKLAYKPLRLAFGIAGGLVAGVVFKRVWKLATGGADVPDAEDFDSGWGEVLAAAALHGAILALVKAAAHRGGAAGIAKLTGSWPT